MDKLVPYKDIIIDLIDAPKSCAYCKLCTWFCVTSKGYYLKYNCDKDVVKGCQGKCSDFVDERS